MWVRFDTLRLWKGGDAQNRAPLNQLERLFVEICEALCKMNGEKSMCVRPDFFFRQCAKIGVMFVEISRWWFFIIGEGIDRRGANEPRNFYCSIVWRIRKEEEKQIMGKWTRGEKEKGIYGGTFLHLWNRNL